MLRRARLRREEGFLLIELLTAIVVMATLFGLFSALLVTLNTRDTTMVTQSVLASEARSTLDTMSDELASALCNGSTQPITSASGTQLTFTAPDRQQPYHLLQITYTLVNGTLTRKAALGTYQAGTNSWTFGTASTTASVESVTNPVAFYFYDSSDPTTTPPPSPLDVNGAAVPAAKLPNIARVTMTLTVTPSTSRGVGSLTAQSEATLRTPQCS